jgi:hypothetical protein
VSVVPSDPLLTFPEAVQVSTEHASLRYIKIPALFAVHGNLPAQLKSAVEATIEEGAITICRREQVTLGVPLSSLKISPVYALDPHGPLAVPTGRIFIRFIPGVKAEDRRPDLEERGYTITHIPSYAAHTAWALASNGDIATALFNIEKLKDLRDVANVEPQLLMQRKNR